MEQVPISFYLSYFSFTFILFEGKSGLNDSVFRCCLYVFVIVAGFYCMYVVPLTHKTPK